jgi:hypothetical protein
VEHLAGVDPARHQVLTRRLDVGDDQVQALHRPRLGRRQVGADLDRAAGPGRRELDRAERVGPEVTVHTPAQPLVEGLGRSTSETGTSTTSSFMSTVESSVTAACGVLRTSVVLTAPPRGWMSW